MSTYGYETIKDIYYDQTDQEQKQEVEDMLLETWEENKGKGLTPSQLIDNFYDKLDEQKKAKKKAAPKKPSKRSRKGSRSTGKKSGNKIDIKQGAKMKNGRVREKQTTKKLSV